MSNSNKRTKIFPDVKTGTFGTYYITSRQLKNGSKATRFKIKYTVRMIDDAGKSLICGNIDQFESIKQARAKIEQFLMLKRKTALDRFSDVGELLDYVHGSGVHFGPLKIYKQLYGGRFFIAYEDSGSKQMFYAVEAAVVPDGNLGIGIIGRDTSFAKAEKQILGMI